MADKSSGGGIGFVGVLTVVFIVLKLTHYINRSWWWVLSPMWIGAIAVVALLVLLAILGAWAGR